ncbi:hypothetical protein P0L94_12140 [Microbacter sp. GSS18]|nr:hypothetical protein P0L94_12140 [Microbacter sp. GSS18]
MSAAPAQKIAQRRRRLAAWRNRALDQCAELTLTAEHTRAASGERADDPGWDAVTGWLDEAATVARAEPRFRQRVRCFWRGSDIDAAWLAIHRAEVAITELTPDATVYAPRIVDAREVGEMFLKPDDHRLRALAGAEKSVKDKEEERSKVASVPAAAQTAADSEEQRRKARELTPGSMVRAAAVLRAAYAAGSEKYRQVRDFRNILILTGLVTFLIATTLGIAGLVAPAALDACWDGICPSGRAVPHPGDVTIIQLYGLVGAAATGAIAVPRLRGTATPYAVPIWSLVLKLPLGAITAYLGLTLLHVVNGITITSVQELAAWAVVFGASQEALTHMIDQRAQSVLNSVPSAAMDQADPGDRLLARIRDVRYREA